MHEVVHEAPFEGDGECSWRCDVEEIERTKEY
jgi:hypothetical protein